MHARSQTTGCQGGGIGEETVQHNRQSAGGGAQHHAGHPHQIKSADFRQHVQAIVCLRLIHSNCPADDIGFVSQLRYRQVSADAHHILRIVTGKHADDRRRRRGVRHPQFTNAEHAYALRRQFSRIANAGQQQRRRLFPAHCRRPGNIAAAARHFHIHQTRDRIRVDTGIDHMHLRARLGRQHADAGIFAGHVYRLNRRDGLRRDRHPFVPDAVIGAHHHNGFFRQLQLSPQPRHSGQLDCQRLQSPQAARWF